VVTAICCSASWDRVSIKKVDVSAPLNSATSRIESRACHGLSPTSDVSTARCGSPRAVNYFTSKIMRPGHVWVPFERKPRPMAGLVAEKVRPVEPSP